MSFVEHKKIPTKKTPKRGKKATNEEFARRFDDPDTFTDPLTTKIKNTNINWKNDEQRLKILRIAGWFASDVNSHITLTPTQFKEAISSYFDYNEMDWMEFKGIPLIGAFIAKYREEIDRASLESAKQILTNPNSERTDIMRAKETINALKHLTKQKAEMNNNNVIRTFTPLDEMNDHLKNEF